MDKPTITASTLQEFTRIESLINELPEIILQQIESAYDQYLIGIGCVIKDQYKDRQNIFIPKETTQICDLGDYIGIYSGKYFFKITGDLYKKNKFNYILV